MAEPPKRGRPARPPTDASGQSLLWATEPVKSTKPKRRATPRVEAVEAEDVAAQALEVAADELRLWSLLLPDESEQADAARDASELVREALVLLEVARRGVRVVARKNRILLPPG